MQASKNPLDIFALIGELEKKNFSPAVVASLLKNTNNSVLIGAVRTLHSLDDLVNKAKNDKELAIQILNSEIVYSKDKIDGFIKNNPKFVCITYPPDDILSIILNHKNDPEFLQQLNENKYFTLKSLSEESIDVFNTILATPELMGMFPESEIEKLAKQHADSMHVVIMPKNNSHLNASVIDTINKHSQFKATFETPTVKYPISFVPSKIAASPAVLSNCKLLDDDDIAKANKLFDMPENREENRISMLASDGQNYAFLKIEDPHTKQDRIFAIYKGEIRSSAEENETEKMSWYDGSGSAIDKGEFDEKKFEEGFKLGEGEFGKVKLMQDINTGEWFVAKIIDISNPIKKISSDLEKENLQKTEQSQGDIVRQKSKEKSPEKYQAIIEKHQAFIEKHQSFIERHEQIVADLQKDITQLLTPGAEMSEKADKALSGQKLNEEDNAKHHALTDNQKNLTDNQKMIEDNKNMIAAYPDAIANNEMLIASNQMLIAENEMLIAQNQKIIETFPDIITHDQQRIADQQKIIASHQNIIASRQDIIAKHKAVIAKHENIIAKNLDYKEHGKHQSIFALKLAPGVEMSTPVSQQLPTLTWIKRATNLFIAINQFHESGLIHRDIKPANLLCDSSNNISIIDLGAALPGPAESTPCGTPGFMPPEVVAADVAYDKDKDSKEKYVTFSDKTDAYSAAVTLGVYLDLIKIEDTNLPGAASKKAVLLDKNDPAVLDNKKIPDKETRDKIIQFLGKMMRKNPEKRKSVKDAVKFFHGLQHEFVDVIEHTRKIAIIDLNEYAAHNAQRFNGAVEHFDEVIFIGSMVKDPNDPRTRDKALQDLRTRFESAGVTVHDHVTFPTHPDIKKTQVIEQVINENKQKNPEGLNSYFYISQSKAIVSKDAHQIYAAAPREKYDYNTVISNIVKEEPISENFYNSVVKSNLIKEIERLNTSYPIDNPERRKKHGVDNRIEIMQKALDKFDVAVNSKTLTRHSLTSGLDEMQKGLLQLRNDNVHMTSHKKTVKIIEKAMGVPEPEYSRPKFR